MFLGANVKKIQLPTLTTVKSTFVENISSSQLNRQLTNKDFVLINVHTPYEGEIAGTDLFINYDEMVANRSKLPQDLNQKIVLYCKTGRMSAEALTTLKGLGYTNVTHLAGGMDAWQKAGFKVLDLAKLPDEVLPADGFTLLVTWKDMGPKLVELGIIDKSKFENAIKLTDEQKKILNEGSEDSITINNANSQFVVDMLWALGLAQKSIVYDEGPLGTEYKNEQDSFASTGGWTLAKGNAVNYLNKYDLIPLTSDQQKRVGEIAKNIYRPCCGNSTWFPDCNHGMAALAAVELLVSKGLSDEEIYKEILKLNSFWFPDNYLMVATLFARQGVSWNEIDAKEVLGEKYSSAQGAGELYEKVGPLPYGGSSGGSCGA